MNVRVILFVASALFAAAVVSYMHDRPAREQYQRECHPPTVDNHGHIVVPSGTRWPCSENNPLL